MSDPKALYNHRHNRKLRCDVCPNNCMIAEGRHGICRVRVNSGGILSLPFYGRLSAVAVDPIEKKPLYHFYPSKTILSIGFVGCSFRCPFCQNYSISQSTSRGLDYTSPEKAVELAVMNNSFGIAYTYSEPIVHLEYVLECADIARGKGLKNVLVSNGYINPEPAKELLKSIDAANIDLKSFNPAFYKKELGGALEPVLDFIRLAADAVHIEVTTLIIPGKNDSDEEVRSLSSFLSEISPDIPLHLSCYYPTYKYSIPRTTADNVRHLADIAKEKLHYVYLGNVGLEESNTRCPNCGHLLIERSGYSTQILGLTNGTCNNCSTSIAVLTG